MLSTTTTNVMLLPINYDNAWHHKRDVVAHQLTLQTWCCCPSATTTHDTTNPNLDHKPRKSPLREKEDTLNTCRRPKKGLGRDLGRGTMNEDRRDFGNKLSWPKYMSPEALGPKNPSSRDLKTQENRLSSRHPKFHDEFSPRPLNYWRPEASFGTLEASQKWTKNLEKKQHKFEPKKQQPRNRKWDQKQLKMGARGSSQKVCFWFSQF